MSESGFAGFEEIVRMRSQRKRLEEIMVDANGDDEQDDAMDTYVSECLQCPFEARMHGRKKGEKITILKLVADDMGCCEIRCEALVRGARVRVPLIDIEPLASAGVANRRVVEDYRVHACRAW